jgi:hypothetical protein
MNSPDELLANPAQFDSLPVDVVGYHICEFEHHAIYSSPEDAKSNKYEAGIWISGMDSVSGRAECEQLTHKWVRIIGRFNNRRNAGAGHFNLWPASLSAIKSAEPVRGSKQKLVEQGESGKASPATS